VVPKKTNNKREIKQQNIAVGIQGKVSENIPRIDIYKYRYGRLNGKVEQVQQRLYLFKKKGALINKFSSHST